MQKLSEVEMRCEEVFPKEAFSYCYLGSKRLMRYARKTLGEDEQISRPSHIEMRSKHREENFCEGDEANDEGARGVGDRHMQFKSKVEEEVNQWEAKEIRHGGDRREESRPEGRVDAGSEGVANVEPSLDVGGRKKAKDVGGRKTSKAKKNTPVKKGAVAVAGSLRKLCNSQVVDVRKKANVKKKKKPPRKELQ